MVAIGWLAQPDALRRGVVHTGGSRVQHRGSEGPAAPGTGGPEEGPEVHTIDVCVSALMTHERIHALLPRRVCVVAGCHLCVIWRWLVARVEVLLLARCVWVSTLVSTLCTL